MRIMRQQRFISLNDDWLYFFAENSRHDLPQVEANLAQWIPLPSLRDWAVSSSVQSGADWFRREVNLDAYVSNTIIRLLIDKAPEEVHVYFNGELLGVVEGGRSLTFDISPKVVNGENIVALRLICVSNSGGGSFGNVQLDVQSPTLTDATSGATTG